ncbi:MAG: sensor histidine kinase [Trebonia sp.]
MPDHVPLAEPAGRMTPPVEACAPAPGKQHAWEAGGLGWDAFYLLTFAAVVVIVVVSTPGSAIVAGVALAAAIPWYIFLGRPLWTGTRAGGWPGRARATAYVIGLFALFAVAQSQNPEVWFLAFAISPQLFSFLDPRLAVWLGIGLNFLAAALLVYRYPTGATAATAFGIAAAGGGFSIFYSGWVSRIIQQSAERAAIIAQLEATRAELAATQHEAGRLAERQRIAADIHDTLAQGFTSILMLIQAAQADLETDALHPSAPSAGRHLDLAARTARENLEEARTLVAGLPPAQLDSGTLADALHRLSSQAPETDTSFALCGVPRPLPMATEVVLLRVCQEALANVGKHARARSAAVRLDYDTDTVRLEVSDDGTGFDPDRVSGGYGLRGMRTRVAEAGGTLTVCSSADAGTRVRAVVSA